MSALKHIAAVLLTATAAVAITSAAQAQDFTGVKAGDIVVRARVVGVIPQEKGHVRSDTLGDLPITVNVDNSVIPELDATYFVTPNIGVNLIAGTTRHKATANAGALDLGTVNVGKVSLLPPTLTVTYHPLPTSRVNPYVGAGINYTWFYNGKGANDAPLNITNTKYDNRFGWALQAGTDVYLTNNWLLNFDVKKIFLNTNVKMNSAVGPLSSKVTLDPWLVGVGVGYKF